MKVTDINSKNYTVYEPKELKKSDLKQLNKNNQDKLEINQAPTNWQKEILLDALTMIENNIQLDNNKPLDKLENQPIETFDEALIELNWLKTPFFKAQALGAQANIEAKDVLYLFVD